MKQILVATRTIDDTVVPTQFDELSVGVFEDPKQFSQLLTCLLQIGRTAGKLEEAFRIVLIGVDHHREVWSGMHSPESSNPTQHLSYDQAGRTLVGLVEQSISALESANSRLTDIDMTCEMAQGHEWSGAILSAFKPCQDMRDELAQALAFCRVILKQIQDHWPYENRDRMEYFSQYDGPAKSAAELTAELEDEV